MNKRLNIIFIISIISIIFNIILAAAKIFIGIEISSQTIISDAIHSASDVLSTIIIMIGAVIANKQADENHPYGHERFEEIGAIILGCILFFTGFEITQSAIVSLINNDYSINIENSMLGISISIISIAIKFLMYYISIIYAKKINSSSLKADGYHHLSDSLSSIGALVGLIFVNFNYAFMDSIAAIIIALFVFKAAIDIIKEATDKLTDAACDKEIYEKILEIINNEDVYIDDMKTRKFSNKIYIDIEIALDSNLSLKESHDKAQKLHDLLEEKIPNIKHCMVHVNPI